MLGPTRWHASHRLSSNNPYCCTRRRAAVAGPAAVAQSHLLCACDARVSCVRQARPSATKAGPVLAACVWARNAPIPPRPTRQRWRCAAAGGAAPLCAEALHADHDAPRRALLRPAMRPAAATMTATAGMISDSSTGTKPPCRRRQPCSEQPHSDAQLSHSILTFPCLQFRRHRLFSAPRPLTAHIQATSTWPSVLPLSRRTTPSTSSRCSSKSCTTRCA